MEKTNPNQINRNENPIMFRKPITSVAVRRFATVVTTLALSVSGLVFSPAIANVPDNGSYSCASGVKDGPTPRYTIANGSVTALSGAICTGAASLPEGLTSIGDEAFKNATGLTSITIPASVTAIGGGAFDGSGVQTVVIAPNSQMTSIGPYAFIGARSLSYIAIPSSVTSIGIYAFHEGGLSSITIPANVTSIGTHAFSGSNSLASVTFLGDTEPTVGAEAFTNVASSAKAIIKSGLTGFIATGSPLRWNGLEVVSNSADVAAAAAEHACIDADQGAELARIQAAAAAEQTCIAAAAEQARIAAEPARIAAAAAAEQARNAAATEQARIAAAAAEDLASRTISAKQKYSLRSLANQTGIKIVSPKAKVTTTVAGSSKKVCAKSGSTLKTLVAGNCVVSYTVQEPKQTIKTFKSFVVGEVGSGSALNAKTSYSMNAIASANGISRSAKGKLSMTVAKSSKGVCSKSGSNLKMLKAGTCNVTFTVDEPKPGATKTTKTFVVK